MWALSSSQGHSKAFGAKVFRSTLKISGICLLSGFVLLLSNADLAIVSCSLGLTGGLGLGGMDSKWRLAGSYHLWMLVQLPAQPDPPRLDSGEKQCPYVENGEEKTVGGADCTARDL